MAVMRPSTSHPHSGGLSQKQAASILPNCFLTKRTPARSSDQPVTSRVPEPTTDDDRRSDRGDQPGATARPRRRAARRRRAGVAPKRGSRCGRIGNFLPCKLLTLSTCDFNRNSQAARQSFEPTRFGGIAAREGTRQNGVVRKWRRNGLIRLNPRPEMVGSRKAPTHKIWYTGARLPPDVPRIGGTPREGGAARGRRRLSTRLARRPGSSADSVEELR